MHVELYKGMIKEGLRERLNLCVILLCSMKMKEMLSSSSSSSSSKVRMEEEDGEDGESQTTSGERLGLEGVIRKM